MHNFFSASERVSHALYFFIRYNVMHRVVKRRGYHGNRPHRNQAAGDQSSDDVAVGGGERDGEGLGGGGRREGLVREEGGGYGEDEVLIGAGDVRHGNGSDGVEGGVEDSAGSGYDTETGFVAAAELSNCFNDVVAVRDLENERSHVVVVFKKKGLGLVLGALWTALGLLGYLNGGSWARRLALAHRKCIFRFHGFSLSCSSESLKAT